MPVLEDNRVAMGLRWLGVSYTPTSVTYESEKGDRLTLAIGKMPVLNDRLLPVYVGDLNAVLDHPANQQFIDEHCVLRGARSLLRA